MGFGVAMMSTCFSGMAAKNGSAPDVPSWRWGRGATTALPATLRRGANADPSGTDRACAAGAGLPRLAEIRGKNPSASVRRAQTGTAWSR